MKRARTGQRGLGLPSIHASIVNTVHQATRQEYCAWAAVVRGARPVGGRDLHEGPRIWSVARQAGVSAVRDAYPALRGVMVVMTSLTIALAH